MPAPSEDDITHALAQVRDPASGKNVVESGLVDSLALHDGFVSFALAGPPVIDTA